MMFLRGKVPSWVLVVPRLVSRLDGHQGISPARGSLTRHLLYPASNPSFPLSVTLPIILLAGL